MCNWLIFCPWQPEPKKKKKKDLGFIKKPQLLMSKNYKIYIILGSWNTGHANHPIEFYFIS